MSDRDLHDGFFLSSSSEDPEANENPSKDTINYYSIPPISDYQLRLWLQNAPIISMEDQLQAQADEDHLLSNNFEISSSRKVNPNENSCLNDINLHDVDKDQSSCREGNHVPDFLEIQPKDNYVGNPSENPCLDDIVLRDLDKDQSSVTERNCVPDFLEIQTKDTDVMCGKKKEAGEDRGECKQRKRKRSTEVHNLNDRLRRQKLTKKMKALQEMIPNSSKRNQASTIDEAIKYIQTLQYQLQMMSIGVGHSMFHSPLMMMPQPGHQGICQIHNLAPLLQTAPSVGGIKYGIETGISSMFTSFNFPTSQLGLPNPCLLPSSSPTSAAVNTIKNPENFLGSLYATIFPYFGSQSNKQVDRD